MFVSKLENSVDIMSFAILKAVACRQVSVICNQKLASGKPGWDCVAGSSPMLLPPFAADRRNRFESGPGLQSVPMRTHHKDGRLVRIFLQAQ